MELPIDLSLPFDIPEILKFGIIGLGTIMAVLAFSLLKREQTRSGERPQMIKAIYVFMAFAIILTLIGLFGENDRVINKKMPIIEGKWLYVCSGSNGKYQHGGRFVAMQDGRDWELNGERMWKDTLNDISRKWNEINYDPSKSWKTVWGNVCHDEIRFEYLIPNVNGEDIHGYASGRFTLNKENQIVKVKGTFNQLYPSKQISGEIELIRVNDSTYESPKWPKNHSFKN